MSFKFFRKKTKEELRKSNIRWIKGTIIFCIIVGILALICSHILKSMNSSSDTNNTQNNIETTVNNEDLDRNEIEEIIDEYIDGTYYTYDDIVENMTNFGYSQELIEEILNTKEVDWDERTQEKEENEKEINEENEKDENIIQKYQQNKETLQDEINNIQKVLLEKTGLTSASAKEIATIIAYNDIDSISDAQTTASNKIKITSKNNSYELLMKSGYVKSILNIENNEYIYDVNDIKENENIAEVYNSMTKGESLEYLEEIVSNAISFNDRQKKEFLNTLYDNNIYDIATITFPEKNVLHIITTSKIMYTVTLESMQIQKIQNTYTQEVIYEAQKNDNKLEAISILQNNE